MRVSKANIVPNVQQYDSKGGSTVVPNEPILTTHSNLSSETTELARQLFESTLDTDVTVESGRYSNGFQIELTLDAEQTKPLLGEYRVSVSKEKIQISAPDESGIHYGCRTVIELLDEQDGVFSVPWFDIHDWPDHEWRSLMVDPARGFIPPERLKQIIDKMAQAKMNRLHMHLADAEAYTIESESYPNLAGGFEGEVPDADFLQTKVKREDYYSIEAIAELVEYATQRDIELIPEIDVPGHATQILTKYPELQCEVEDDDPSKWSMCIGSGQTYEFLANLMDDVAKQFPSDIIHIGTDEWEFDLSWRECEVCQQRMEEEGLETIHELFTYFLKRVHTILAERDKRMMIWNETVDRSGLSELPDDILIQFWRYSPDNWDIDGCTMADYLEEGHDLVNSYVPAAYIDRHTTEDYLLGWTPTRRPQIAEEHEDQILGGEMTAWSGWEDESWQAYYQRALPSAIPVFNNQVWNATPVEDPKSLYRAVEQQVLGPSLADELPLYDELGGVILPVDSDRNRVHADYRASIGGRSTAGAKSDYERMRDRLAVHLDDEQPRHPDAVRAYIDCFDWLIEVAEGDGQGNVDRLYQ